ncbi:type II secretion system minor pseudopilin GspI [Sphingomonas sp. TX0543]|uniref:type II secretion system minor pseudopilin GspI n=1 Tax=unclassified Sphingomonas TaxID=196159 RepID=UPI0010F8E3F2|nr:type II secretion system minor pseudopilin GspI [Sphingomonas sp. 3P27F8]
MAERRTGDGFAPWKRSAEHGFTLIEIMVALAVFSLAILALIRLEGATIRSTGTLDSTLLAQTVARNVAIDAVTDGRPPLAGRSEGNERNGGRDWHWVRDVRAIGDGQVMRIDVSVTDRDGRVIGRLMMVRPEAIAAP